MNQFTKKNTKSSAPARGANPDRRQVKKKESTLDPRLFVKKAQPSGQEGFRTEKPLLNLA
jgi:ATP-dependent RNA helicase RhlE